MIKRVSKIGPVRGVHSFVTMYMVYSEGGVLAFLNKFLLSKDLIKSSVQNLSEIPESDI